MLMGDHANQAIFCAAAGLLCGLLWPFGLWASIMAYKELPWKRTQAIVGIVLNSIGTALLVVVVLARIYLASANRLG
jgi:hypothetical protein